MLMFVEMWEETGPKWAWREQELELNHQPYCYGGNGGWFSPPQIIAVTFQAFAAATTILILITLIAIIILKNSSLL